MCLVYLKQVNSSPKNKNNCLLTHVVSFENSQKEDILKNVGVQTTLDPTESFQNSIFSCVQKKKVM